MTDPAELAATVRRLGTQAYRLKKRATSTGAGRHEIRELLDQIDESYRAMICGLGLQKTDLASWTRACRRAIAKLNHNTSGAGAATAGPDTPILLPTGARGADEFRMINPKTLSGCHFSTSPLFTSKVGSNPAFKHF
jgi:hypothetical protein